MKKLNVLAIAAVFALASCEKDSVATDDITNSAVEAEFESADQTSDFDGEVDLSVEDFEEIQRQFFDEIKDLDLSDVEGLGMEVIDFQDADVVFRQQSNFDWSSPQSSKSHFLVLSERCRQMSFWRYSASL